MGSLSRDYLGTRLAIFASRLIERENLSEWVSLDLEQIINRLQQISGRSFILNQPQAPVIQHQLMSHALEDFQILLRSFSAGERRFFYFAIRWFELVNLKVLIRGKFTATDSTMIKKQLVELGAFADLPLKALLETEDPYEMLRLLETTAYAGIVRQARHVFEEQGNDLFLLDATIDRSFFIDLKQRTRFLEPRDAAELQKVMGTLLDRFNLLWLLRYRFAYGLSPAKSFYLLTAIGSKLYAADLMRLAKMETVAEVIDALPQPLRELLEGIESISDIEIMMEYLVMSVASETIQHKHSEVAQTFAYLLLREAEVRFCQALIKGKQLGLEDTLIERAIGGRR